ncbi:MAG: hypothetical protein C5B52_05020 [Bacteroidetes bacterium]|nr:MAG: hypothetical protein C5B52_05020 [Bacteroidota bacterium]
MRVILLNWLTDSFKKDSIIWLLISGVIGGIVGAAIKSFFEEVVNPKLRERRVIKKVVNKYTLPLIRSADSLQGRIINFLWGVKHENFNFSDDQQYRLSTLYSFARFLGWVRVLEEEVSFLNYDTTNQTRIFNIRLNTVFKAFTSTYYFQEDGSKKEIFTVYRSILTGIGDIVVLKEEGIRYVMGYAEFVSRFDKDKDFAKWFDNLEKLFKDIEAKESDTRWDRLLIIYAHLNALRWFLDPSTKRGNKPRFDLHYLTSDSAQKKIQKELEKAGIPSDIIRWPEKNEES